MTPQSDQIISDTEKDILGEIMNIAFGSATADLDKIIDIYVKLSVPNIKVAGAGELQDYLRETIVSYHEVSIIEQEFWGSFSGSGLLVFPASAAKELMTILMCHGADAISCTRQATLDEEILLEIGNILIGACVGKISELLGTVVTYSPPQVINRFITDFQTFIQSFDPFQTAVIMKTVFIFEKNDVNGLLLLLTHQESIGWLKKALNAFMEPYQK
jgi:chemotaxis protein CheC